MAEKDKNKLQNIISNMQTAGEVSQQKSAEIFPGYSSVENFTKNGFKTLVEATRCSNSLPQGSNWNFYNTHKSFKDIMNMEGNKILLLINDVLKYQGVNGNIKSRDLEEKVELIVEANDIILERVANNLDELAGIRKNPVMPVEIQAVSAEIPINGSWNRINKAKFSISSTLSSSSSASGKSLNSIRLLTGKNIPRPQTTFKDCIDNSKNPWEPRIKEKPNSLKPLAIFLEETEDGCGETFCHPYEFELDRFEPATAQLTYVEPRIPKPLSQTPLHFIETAEQLNELVEDLRNYKEISVDLEHHSYRTFLGITCLMQISTNDADYLIDTLKLRDKLYILNEIFTKPSILKIFHGADQDVLWLQRDLSLYVVNMFDTHLAAKQLNFTHLSLAYLLKRFCGIDADKHFQLADWRIRPLPEELKTYAREDTHYLIYIYHLLRNALLDSGNNADHILKAVLRSSTNICKKRYFKPVLHEDSHMELYRKYKKLFNNRQLYALKEVYKWRDQTARMEDESTGYVLPNHMLLQICELLPREMQGVLACCNPIPPLVRANLLELHKIILRAREQSLTKPIFSAETRVRGNTQRHSKFDVESILNCPHDLSVPDEFRDDRPTLLDNISKRTDQKSSSNGEENQNNVLFTVVKNYNTVLQIEKTKAAVDIFETPENSDDDMNNTREIKQKIQNMKFLGPYERYKLVKPYIQAEEDKLTMSETDKSNIERTDAERIASLQQHFKALAAATTQIKPNSDTYKPAENISENYETESRGKKRKRDLSIPRSKSVVTKQALEPPAKLLKEDTTATNTTTTTTITTTATTNKPKKKNKNKKKNNNKNKKQKQQINSLSYPQFHSDNNYNCQEYEANRIKYNNLRFNQQNNQNLQYNNKQPQKQRGMKRKYADSQNNFKPFDYGSVNYAQFQGGAGSAMKPTNIKSKFKSKGQKKKKCKNIAKNVKKFKGFNSEKDVKTTR